MTIVAVIQFEEPDSKTKAADRLIKLWGSEVVGPDQGFCLLAVTGSCTDLEKAKEICRLYGGKSHS